MKYYDIIIAGAGPAGLLTALNLKNSNFSICIIEKEKEDDIGKKNICGGACDYNLLKKYNIQGLLSLNIINKVKIINNKKTINFSIDNKAIFNREEFDKKIFYLVKKQKNTIIKTNEKVIEFTEKENIVIKTNKNKFECKYFIIATGPLNIFAKNKNIGFSIEKNRYAYGGRILINENHKLQELVFDFTGEIFGYMWIFENKKDTNIGNGIYFKQKINLKEELKVFCKKNNYTYKDNYQGAIVPLEIPQKITSNNIACIGDSAGMINPVTAGGLGSIFIFSEILANSIEKAFKKNKKLENEYIKEVKKTKIYIWIKVFSLILKIKNKNILFYSFVLQFFILHIIKVFRR